MASPVGRQGSAGGRLIRGKKVDQALEHPDVHAKKAAGIIKKALEVGRGQRRAQRRRRHRRAEDQVDLRRAGRTLKRFSARAKGRGNRISKPTCHIYVTVGN